MIDMIKYIKNIIAYFLEENLAVWTGPATNHLFTVRDKSLAKPLAEEQARAFHHAVTQLLFLSARARCHIQPVNAILTTQVRCPDEDNWDKVNRLLG
jgi:hypothetical protein